MEKRNIITISRPPHSLIFIDMYEHFDLALNEGVRLFPVNRVSIDPTSGPDYKIIETHSLSWHNSEAEAKRFALSIN